MKMAQKGVNASQMNAIQISPVIRRINALMRSLSVKDRLAIKELLKCELFCRDPKVRKLYDLLYQNNTAFQDDTRFDYSNLFIKIFPKHKYNDQLWSSILSTLCQAVELYIGTIQLKQNPAQVHYYNALHLSVAKEEKTFKRELGQAKKRLANLPASRDKLYQEFRLAWLEWLHPSTERHDPEVLQHLKRCYWAYHQTIEHYLNCVRLSSSDWMKQEEKPTKDEPSSLVDIYKELAKLFDENKKGLTGSKMEAFWGDFRSKISEFEPAENEAILRILINLCIQKAHQGNKSFTNLLTKLILWSSRNVQFFTSRWLAVDDDFLNVALALGHGRELGKMQKFILEYGQKLDIEVRDNAIELANAYYHYFDHRPDMALFCLNKVSTKASKYGVRYYSLLLRMTYEDCVLKNDGFRLDEVVERCTRYFRKKDSLPEKRKQQYLDLCWFVRQLATVLKHPVRERSEAMAGVYKKLKLELQSEKKTPMSKEWVEDQVERLLHTGKP